MTIYDLKPKFQSLLRPLVNKLANNQVTANQVTLYAILLSVFGGFIVWISSIYSLYLLIFIPIIMFVRMALNAIDGMLAKEHNMISKDGGILNEFGDVLSDTVLFLPFAFILNPFVVIVFVVLSIFTEFMGVLTQAIYNTRRYDGPIGKSDRAFLLGALSLVLVYDSQLKDISSFVLGISCILLVYTTYNRWIKAKKESSL